MPQQQRVIEYLVLNLMALLEFRPWKKNQFRKRILRPSIIRDSLVLLASHWSSSLASLSDLLREAPAQFPHNQLVFLRLYFLHPLWYDVRSTRGSDRWAGQGRLPGLHTPPPATPAAPAHTCPPSTPSTVNYPDPALIDHSESSWHEGPQLKNDKCSPSRAALEFVSLSHRPSFKSIDPGNQWPEPCLHKFFITDHWFLMI